MSQSSEFAALVDSLPDLEELGKMGPPKGARFLTSAEKAQAKADRKAKPKHLQTKRKSEALCKRQLEKWGATIHKARDDERVVKGKLLRISTDVDFVGTIPLCINGVVSAYPLKVESKGITLKQRVKRYTEDGRKMMVIRGSFPLKSLTSVQRRYLEDNRQRGGLSIVHIAWWLNGKCDRVDVIPWKEWATIEHALLNKAEWDKRYSGKSLRYHVDLALLNHTEVVKFKGKWELVIGHWLAPLLASGEQPTLL